MQEEQSDVVSFFGLVATAVFVIVAFMILAIVGYYALIVMGVVAGFVLAGMFIMAVFNALFGSK